MSSDLNFLIEMGFPKSKAERALAASGNAGIELAMEWLMSHENDPDVEMSEGAGVSPSQSASDASQGGDPVAKSIKCDDCGKLLRSVEEAEFHASKTNHSNFSESTEEKKPLTEAEKKEQVVKLQEKLRQKKQEREEKEKKEDHDREMKRRQMGREISTAKSKHDELEIQKIAEERRREKEEDKRARQKIKDELERDKLERQQKFANKTAAAPTAQPAAPAAVKTYDKCKLQIRYTNGQAVTQEFGAKESLSAVRLFVELNRPDGAGPFVLMTTFPKKVFTGADMDTPLCELGLVPSAVLVVTKSS